MISSMTRPAALVGYIDRTLCDTRAFGEFEGFKRFVMEFIFFGLKEARACLFVGLFFLAVFTVPRAGVLGLPRYDVLLVITVAIQAWMLWSKLETWDEVKVICVFHAVGFVLEVFKTSGSIQSWSYPEAAYTKIWGVPLFAGFMYAAIGSYIIQAWRLFDMRIRHHPPLWMATMAALAIYLNFFLHHYIGDYRWYIAALTIGLYARSTVIFRPYDRERRMPLVLAFILVGFFIWLAENISTLFGIWRYPDQAHIWTAVHIGKWSSWSLLVIMSFTMIADSDEAAPLFRDDCAPGFRDDLAPLRPGSCWSRLFSVYRGWESRFSWLISPQAVAG